MVLDMGNMEGDQLSQIQGHLALTVWMLPYEVVSCLDEDDSCRQKIPLTLPSKVQMKRRVR